MMGLMTTSKEYNFVYADCRAFINEEYRGMVVEWGCEGIGFGELTMCFDEKGEVTMDTEGMSNEFVKALLNYVVDQSKSFH